MAKLMVWPAPAAPSIVTKKLFLTSEAEAVGWRSRFTCVHFVVVPRICVEFCASIFPAFVCRPTVSAPEKDVDVGKRKKSEAL